MRPSANPSGDFQKFAAYCENMLKDKGGVNVLTYDLRDRNAPSEFTVIASGTSTRHATALSEHLIKEVKKDYGVWPENIEGQAEGPLDRGGLRRADHSHVLRFLSVKNTASKTCGLSGANEVPLSDPRRRQTSRMGRHRTGRIPG
jgi:hypothetical protein